MAVAEALGYLVAAGLLFAVLTWVGAALAALSRRARQSPSAAPYLLFIALLALGALREWFGCF